MNDISRIRLRRYCFPFFLLFIILPLWSSGQFVGVFAPSTSDLNSITNCKARVLIETDIPGKELVISGNLIGKDTSGWSIQPFYVMTMDFYGNPSGFSWYEDGSSFIFTGASGYGLAWDGKDKFYCSGGSNSNQVIHKVGTNGNYQWTRVVHHHEFYEVLYQNDTSIIALGQDESVAGVHDFSLIRIDSGGNIRAGMMMGTPNFDIPEKIIPTQNGYLLSGEANDASNFKTYVMEVDQAFNPIWANTYSVASQSQFGKGLAEAIDGSGYYVSGYMRGTSIDSMFIMKINLAGNPLWFKNYQTDPIGWLNANSMDIDPVTGDLFICGAYRNPSFSQPFVLKTDSLGNIIWARGYGGNVDSTSQYLNKIIVLKGIPFFAACGDYYKNSSPNLHRPLVVSASLDSGSVPCDTTLIFQSSNSTVVVTGGFITQAFLDAPSYPFGGKSGVLVQEQFCAWPMEIEMVSSEKGSFLDVFYSSDGTIGFEWWLPGNQQNGTIALRSLDGRWLDELKLTGHSGKLQYDCQQLSQGIYLAVFRGEGEILSTKKWVVMR